MDWEVELAVVIGATASHVTEVPDNAADGAGGLAVGGPVAVLTAPPLLGGDIAHAPL